MTDLANLSSIIGMFVGFVFTLLIFSYLLGDNALFRFATHVFIGVSAGYIASMAFFNVIWPRLLSPALFGLPEERLLAAVPLLLSGLLLAKVTSRLNKLGSPVMAFLAGVGAAVVVGGAVTGTLFPQTAATINLFDMQAIQTSGRSISAGLFNGAIMLAGVLVSLAYFHFHTRAPKPAWLQAISWAGQAMIAIALGAVFAGVYMAALAALVERLGALVEFIRWFINPAT
jgi:hypothetical protein